MREKLALAVWAAKVATFGSILDGAYLAGYAFKRLKEKFNGR